MLTQKRIRVTGALLGTALLLTSITMPLTTSTGYALTLSEANQAASEASAAYDEAVENQEAIAAEIEALEESITTTEELLADERDELGGMIVNTYKNGTIANRVASVLVSEQLTISGLITAIENLLSINEWQSETVEAVETTLALLEEQRTELEEKKATADAAVEEALAVKEEALDAQEAARAISSLSTSSASSTRSSYASGAEDTDEEAARLWIINKESGGNYNAVSASGKYYGAYQLTKSYLNDDYSVANQDATAQAYVEGRYSLRQ